MKKTVKFLLPIKNSVCNCDHFCCMKQFQKSSPSSGVILQPIITVKRCAENQQQE